MKTFNSILATACASMLTLSVLAQGPKVPAASPGAMVKQTFGLTDISVDYSSPMVMDRTTGKDRVIWGDLVPYDKVWRTGANHATVIEFSTNVKVGDSMIRGGKYAFFAIPGKDMWTLILNKDWDQWGSFGYDQSKDKVRIMVKPEMTADTKERLAYYLDPTSDSTCTVTLRWEKVKVSFTVKANTVKMMQGSFDNLMGSYANAANYYVDNKLDLNKAQEYAKMAMDMKNTFYTNYIMGKVLLAKGNKAEALKYAQTSKEMGEKVNDDFYGEFKGRIAQLIADCGGK